MRQRSTPQSRVGDVQPRHHQQLRRLRRPHHGGSRRCNDPASIWAVSPKESTRNVRLASLDFPSGELVLHPLRWLIDRKPHNGTANLIPKLRRRLRSAYPNIPNKQRAIGMLIKRLRRYVGLMQSVSGYSFPHVNHIRTGRRSAHENSGIH